MARSPTALRSSAGQLGRSRWRGRGGFPATGCCRRHMAALVHMTGAGEVVVTRSEPGVRPDR
jgi:hypothetical protein